MSFQKVVKPALSLSMLSLRFRTVSFQKVVKQDSSLEYGVDMPIMTAATDVNESMAGYIVEKVKKQLLIFKTLSFRRKEKSHNL